MRNVCVCMERKHKVKKGGEEINPGRKGYNLSLLPDPNKS